MGKGGGPMVGRRSSIMAGGRAGGRGTRTQKAAVKKDEKPAAAVEVQVVDEEGVNRTPVSLMSQTFSHGAERPAPPPPMSGNSTPTADQMSETMSARGVGDGSITPDFGPDMDGMVSPPSEMAGGAAARATSGVSVVTAGAFATRNQGPDDMVTISLQETETFFLLNIQGSSVSVEAPDASEVKDRTEAYRKLLKEKNGSEMFNDQNTQTVNPITKAKQVQLSMQEMQSVSVQSSNWNIHDSFEARERGKVLVESDDAGALGERFKDPGFGGVKVDEAMRGSSSSGDGTSREKKEEVEEKLKNLEPKMMLLERALAKNIYHNKLLTYRDVHPFKEVGKESPQLQHLWDFKCPLVKDYNVACMAFNHVHQDLLAVGYGEHSFLDKKNGLLAFWSLKNPGNPELVIECSSGVTSIDFSKASGNLLAVGLYNGTVAIYDVRSRSKSPVLESTYQSGKHSDPVWKLQWVDMGADKGESLVSISTDGRITEWSLKKGLEFTDLMKLKRATRKDTGQKSEAFISRRSSGTCFDFSRRDPSIYMAGTEEGNIHKCSCSYIEQYLESYEGHMGPVYQIVCSPFSSKFFLSASNDWTIKLWSEFQDSALVTFQHGSDEINDVKWCPSNSTVFGAVTSGGKVEVWDISTSILKPVLISIRGTASLTCLEFAQNAPIMVVGSSDGKVAVYRLQGIAGQDPDVKAQMKKLEEAMEANVIKGSS